MGAMMQMPQAVTSTIVERHGTKAFHVGVAEMNGWRPSMEDAHIIFLKDTWGFFGVFDGHGGQECSTFVANRIHEQLTKNGCPADDAAVKKLVLDVDEEFLDSQKASGSTAAMCIVELPTDGGKHRLRVINAGDSRVLLGRRDGTIVDGGGTDKGLTTDHKPNHPVERERIERCGGRVEMVQGCARVNGDLAVSRGFGDRSCKETGGPGPEDRPVTADPEMGRFQCDRTDFLLIVCDGVSEGKFENEDVVSFVADQLRDHGDPGAAARAVCHKAVETNSKDNITCMCILFSEWDETGAGALKYEFTPGPMKAPDSQHFIAAYKAFGEKAGCSLGETVKMRYETIQMELERTGDPESEEAKILEKELSNIGEPGGSKGSAEYDGFFERWESTLENNTTPDDLNTRFFAQLLAQSQQQVKGPEQGTGEFVRTPGLEELKSAMDNHKALSWDDRHEDVVERVGEVLQKDEEDGTTQVRFTALSSAGKGIIAWLPTAVLIEASPPE